MRDSERGRSDRGMTVDGGYATIEWMPQPASERHAILGPVLPKSPQNQRFLTSQLRRDHNTTVQAWSPGPFRRRHDCDRAHGRRLRVRMMLIGVRLTGQYMGS